MNLPAQSVVKVKEVPLWSIVVFVLGLVFTGGQLYAQQQEQGKKLVRLEEIHESEITELRKHLRVLENLERDALSQIKVIATKLEIIGRAIDKLEKRNEMRYSEGK